MVQTGTPEQYFGTPVGAVAITEPVEARILEPVKIADQLQVVDYTPLIIGVCFLGLALVVFGLGFIWITKGS